MALDIREEPTLDIQPLDIQEEKQGTNLSTTEKVIIGGLATKGIIDFLFQPANEIKKIKGELQMMSSEVLKEPKISINDIPSRLSRQGQIDVSNKQAGLTGLKRAISNFDDTVLGGNIETLSNTFKEEMPKFFNDTYKIYGKQLDSIDSNLIKSGKAVMSNQYLDVIDKTIVDSIASGVPEDKLSRLIKFRDNLSSGVASVDELTPPMSLNQKSSIKQIKGFTNSLAQDIPTEAAFRLRENYGKFLENNFPEAQSKLSAMNKDYAKFSQVRKAMYRTVDPATGMFDKTKLNKMLYSYAQSKVETGLKDTINFMAQGTSISPKVDKIGSQFSDFSQNVSKRKTMQLDVPLLQDKISKSKMNTLNWINKSEKLLSEMSGISERHPVRSGMEGMAIRKGATVGAHAGISQMIKKAIRPLGVLPMISGAASTFYDPEQALGAQMGIMIPDKGTKERAILNNIIKKEPIPEDMNVTQDEEKEVLLKWGMLI